MARCSPSGVPMAVIARQLGHADTRMTEKHYAHLTDCNLRVIRGGSFQKLNLRSATRFSQNIFAQLKNAG